MSDLFSAEWMTGFMNAWNAEPELSGALAKINFNSVIGYGFPGDDSPKGVLTVENGIAVAAAAYDGQELNWDIRCKDAHWAKWMRKPPGMAGLGMAFTTGKMKFDTGDYFAMIKDPRMAMPFIKSFTVMGGV